MLAPIDLAGVDRHRTRRIDGEEGVDGVQRQRLRRSLRERAVAVEAQIDRVRSLGFDELRALRRRTFRSSPPSAFTKDLVARFICRHLQEQAFGGLDHGLAGDHLAVDGVELGQVAKMQRHVALARINGVGELDEAASQNGRDRRLGEPVMGHAILERVLLFGTRSADYASMPSSPLQFVNAQTPDATSSSHRQTPYAAAASAGTR